MTKLTAPGLQRAERGPWPHLWPVPTSLLLMPVTCPSGGDSLDVGCGGLDKVQP